MFNFNKRAFNKLAESFPLAKIETKHHIPWIQDLFNRKKVHLPASLIESIIETFENHPMYIQNFLFHLREEPRKKEYSPVIIGKRENMIVEERSLEYAVLWET